MDARRIVRKEILSRRNASYSYIASEKPVEHSGETVEQFLARGGAVREIKKSTMPKRNAKGHFIKEEVNG